MNFDKNLDSGYVKSYYDKFLSSYDKEYSYYRWQAGPVEKIHFFQTKKALKPYLDKLNGHVLEVGGGDAIWTAEYISHIEKLTFLDISEEMIRRAQKRLSGFSDKISFLNNDFLQADFSGSVFDHIVSVRNLEYFTDKKGFMTRIHNLLKVGGTFVLVTKSPKYNLRDSAKEKTLHTSQIDILQLLDLMKSEGLTVTAVYPAIFGKLFRFSLTRFISNMLHRFILILPWNRFFLRIFSYLSESFVIYAKK